MEQSGLKFLADECFSPVLIRILKHLGEKSIQPFKPNFEHGTPDEVWIPQATERGYICITLDRQMLSADKLAPFFVEAKARIIFIGKHLANATLGSSSVAPQVLAEGQGTRGGNEARTTLQGAEERQNRPRGSDAERGGCWPAQDHRGCKTAEAGPRVRGVPKPFRLAAHMQLTQPDHGGPNERRRVR